MSSCRHGGRDTYQRPGETDYRHDEPIRGRLVFKDGTDSKFTTSRFLEDGTERVMDHVEVDDERYERYVTRRYEEKDYIWLSD